VSEREKMAREALQRAEAATEAMHRADQPGRLPLVSVHWAQFYSEDVPRLARALLEAEAKLERLRKELEWLANHPSLPKFVHRGATYGVYLMAGDVQRIRDVVRASPTTEGPEEPGEEEARR
jgi:hypothetical protein